MSKQLVIALKSPDGYGWTETYYYNGISGPSTASADIQAFCTARAGILTSTCRITHARLATTTKRRPQIIPLNFGAGIPGAESPPTEAEEVALELLLTDGAGGLNRKFIRGIPDRVTSANTYSPDQPFIDAFNAWFALLRDSGKYNIQGRPVNPSANTMAQLTPTPPRGYSFISPLGGFAKGDTIRVTGATIPGYNGMKTITRVVGDPAGTFQVGGAAPPVAQPVTNTQAYKLTPYDTLLTTATVTGVSRRAAGRPFGLSRGRQPTLYSLRR